MKPEDKKLLKYLGTIILAIVVLFLIMAGESIINNFLENLLLNK